MAHNTTWQIWLDDQEGRRLRLIDNLSGFTVSKIANSPGACSLTLPAEYIDYIKPDTMIEFWRQPRGGAMRLFNVYFVREFIYADLNGQDKIIANGLDAIELMKRRIVAYAAGSSQAQKTDNADSIIWAIIADNLGVTATDTDRSLDPYLTGDGSPDTAPTITIGYAWRNLLTVCQDICEASREAGTELYFDWDAYIDDESLIKFKFRTFEGYPGKDRTADSTTNMPVFFGREYGNLNNAELKYDYTAEINYIYAGGQGEKENREIVELEDTTRSGISLWNRREGFADVRNATSTDPTDEITSRGNAELEAGRPKISFSGDISDTFQFKFGIDWFFGDKVTCIHFGQQFDAVIKAIILNVDNSGAETLSIRLEADL